MPRRVDPHSKTQQAIALVNAGMDVQQASAAVGIQPAPVYRALKQRNCWDEAIEAAAQVADANQAPQIARRIRGLKLLGDG